MTGQILGAATKPREDPGLLRGEPLFTGDITLPGLLHLELVLSAHGHANIRGIDKSAAEAMPGVVAVLTGEDIGEQLMPLPCVWVPGGVDSHFPPHPYGVPGANHVLAMGRVRYVGESVVAVVAETALQAQDAARAVVIDYEVIPAVVLAKDALAEGAPLLHESVPNNLNARWMAGDEAATRAAIDAAEVVVELDIRNQRTINSPLEPRASVGRYDQATGEYTLWATSQSPHNHRFLLSALVLGIPFNKLRIISNNIGGSFGTKGYLYSDMPLVLWLAKRLGRPVKWSDSRNGLMRNTVQGRDQVQHVILAGTADGKFTALNCVSYANLGAYPSTIGPGVATAMMGRSITGPYQIDNAYCEVSAVFTNVAPLGAQRGSGRAEATFLTERLVDLYAKKIGKDPAEVRRMNMVQPEAMPYDNGLGWLYDSGDYPVALDKALALVGYDKVGAAKAEARTRGKYLGVGIASFVAVCGVGPSTRMGQEGMLGGTWESANLRVFPTGEVALTVGSASTGQNHQTVFAQVAAEVLGCDPDVIKVYQSDTEKAPYGQGTYGSRSFSVAGPAVHLAAQKIVAKIVTAAAHTFDVAESEVTYADGKVFVAGDAEKTKTFAEMAMALWYGWNLPAGMEPTLDVTTFFDPPDFNFPYGTHIALVEVDEDSGRVDVVRYIGVNDVGTVGNPLVVNGQIEGSIVHGFGQALLEEAHYDPQGILRTDSLRTYTIPRAADAPYFELDSTVTPSPHNPIGVKGAGEIATVPPTAAIVNAVCDALADLGVQHIDMPLTPEKVWRAMRDARAGDAVLPEGR